MVRVSSVLGGMDSMGGGVRDGEIRVGLFDFVCLLLRRGWGGSPQFVYVRRCELDGLGFNGWGR